jgi:hypothetical protein
VAQVDQMTGFYKFKINQVLVFGGTDENKQLIIAKPTQSGINRNK